MQKAMLTVVGLAGLSLLLCGSGALMEGSKAPSAEPQNPDKALGLVELPLSVFQLQQVVAQEQRNLVRLGEELGQWPAEEPLGVGGSGQAGEETEEE